jgi:FADH2 O2-dependent halogenase
MIRDHADVAILGAGFAGSLMALVLQRIGRRPVLLERGTHPRFAIGESSTPLANLALEELSRTYDLPRLFPLTKYGRWQRAYPHLVVGLKRGFTFYQHQAGKPFRPTPDHANELLVAANPTDEAADTHWFREQFDHFLVQEAQAAGIPYYDRTEVTAVDAPRSHERGYWKVKARREGEAMEMTASFLIDASGPGGVLARALNIDAGPARVRTNSWSVYTHFAGVDRWRDVLQELGGDVADHPYRCDDAALHHVLEDGWVWVLRFNNGLTSAGILVDGARRGPDGALAPEVEWEATLRRYPSLGRQFAGARPVRPWVRTGRLQRRARQAAGDGWAMLAHAAYFLDALFSGGNAHTLLSIQRLARILEQHWGKTSLAGQLADYDAALQREVDLLDRLIHGCYRAFGRFDLMGPYTMYYFTGAHQSETRRRQGKAGPDDGFLFAHHAPFRSALSRGYEALLELAGGPSFCHDVADTFQAQVAQDIAPYNNAGFCDLRKRNMYPYA